MDPIKLAVPAKHNPIQAPEALGGGMTVTETASLTVTPMRDGGQMETLAVQPDDVLQVEFEGGLQLWISVAQFQLDYGHLLVPSRSADGLAFPLSFQSSGLDRGFGSWVVRTIKALNVNLGKATAWLAAKAQETIFMPDKRAGLWRLQTPNQSEENWWKRHRPVRAEPSMLENDEAHLVFIHGTISSSEGAFQGLGSPAVANQWRILSEAYQGRMFAFDHRTLSVSPIRNAIDLLGTLPKRARLHLVTHSRGGLIGELLCRPPSDYEVVVSSEAVMEELQELRSLLRQKEPVVERFVRVACPMRGTSLASQRLDRYLSVLDNLVNLLAPSPTTKFVRSLALAFAKELVNPEICPGLEAMAPGSALISLLNRQSSPLPSKLMVVSGHSDGSGALGRLLSFAGDLFYSNQHDLVVDTESMYGGAVRAKSSAFFSFHRGKAHHCNYFYHPETVSPMIDGLLDNPVNPQRYTDLDPTKRQQAIGKAMLQVGPAKAPVVFLLPGIMGSHLCDNGNDRIWIELTNLGSGKFSSLKDLNAASEEKLVDSFYGDLIVSLGATHRVIPFPFDWRRSVLDAVSSLKKLVEKELSRDPDVPIRFLAHSMGGLVVRALLAKNPEFLDRPGSRVVFLGTPNNGAYEALNTLLGNSPIVAALKAVDVAVALSQSSLFAKSEGVTRAAVGSFLAVKELIQDPITRQLLGYPGLLQLLPNDTFLDEIGADIKSFSKEADVWNQLGLDKVVQPSVLKQVSEFWSLVKTPPAELAARMVYVAGCAPATIETCSVANQGLVLTRTSEGDGTVTWRSGRLPNVPTYYAAANHGNLPRFKEAFQAYLDLLQFGKTEKLPETPPAVSSATGLDRGAAADHILFLKNCNPIFIQPTKEMLEGLAIGAELDQVLSETREAPVTVRVNHGDFGDSKFPVLLGLYKRMALSGTAIAANRHLNNRLSVRYQAQLLPGSLGTQEVLFNVPGYRGLPGVILTGLGEMGELNPGDLQQSLTQAVLAYSIQCLEREAAPSEREGTPAEPIRLGIGAVLVGRNESGISARDSIQAVVNAVLDTNRHLASWEQRDVRIDRLEFYEVYEDRAIEAAHVVRQLTDDICFRRLVKAAPFLNLLPQGGQKALARRRQGLGWGRLQITEDKKDLLTFRLLTDRARTEVNDQPTQSAILQPLLERAITDARWSLELAVTMFELLVPNELKNQSLAGRDIVLLLDRATAAYPWELMQDRLLAAQEPMAVQAGVIRQLQTRNFRVGVVSTRERRALIIGDPPSDLPALDGAKREAELVQSLLQSRYEAEARIRSSADDCVSTLVTRDFQILHFAGHGIYDPTSDPNDCGMVLGKTARLTPSLVDKMRLVPDLVFLNCCHLGRVEELPDECTYGRNEIAANLATQFIQMGAKAVVAAGWAVNDQCALRFADRFYQEMLKGACFGDAVRLARREAYDYSPGMNTWGAYQCYGDPGFTLDSSGQGGDYAPIFVSPRELCVQLDNLSQKAEKAYVERLESLRQELESLKKAIPQGWLKNGELCLSLARVHHQLIATQSGYVPGSALDSYHADSIAYFDDALAAGSATLDDIGLFEGVRARYSMITKQENVLDECIAKRRAMLLLSRGHKNLSRLGGVLMLRAILLASSQTATGGAQETLVDEPDFVLTSKFGTLQATLQGMRDSYRQANSAYKNANKDQDYHYYQDYQWTAELLLHWRNPNIAAPIIPQAGTPKEEEFFDYLALPRRRLLQALVGGELSDEDQDQILAGFWEAWKRGGSPVKFRAVLDLLDFLRQTCNQAPTKNGLESLMESTMRLILFGALPIREKMPKDSVSSEPEPSNGGSRRKSPPKK